MKITSLFPSILFGVLVIMTMISCSEDVCDNFTPDGKESRITVYATRGGAETRAALNEDNGNLNCSWETGDQLLVTNVSGGVLGTLSLVDKTEGKFEGTLVGLNKDKMLLNYFYLGSGTDLTKVNGSYNVNIASQEGTMAALAKNDVLSAQAEVAIIDGNAYVSGTLALNRHFSFGHFTLEFPEGVTMNDETVNIAGTSLFTRVSFSLTDRSLSGQTAGTITVTGDTKGDFYINLIPATGVAPTFTVAIGGTEYKGTLSAREIKAGIYLREGAKAGIPVKMAKTENEAPDNPGNTEHWGGENISPTWTTNTPKKVATAGGWTVNVKSIYNYGGFGTYVTYNSNGLQSNLLTSKDGTAYYFQWGRWLGFPSLCGRTVINEGGSASGYSPDNSQYLNGVDNYNIKVGYIFGNDLIASYASCYMGNNDWTNDRVLKSSIIFGMVSSFNNTLDYAGANENCKWEGRCGNPCPDGYRIPTATELSALIPSSTDKIKGSHAEIKVIDGIKYAMQWKVNASGTLPCVEIRSVKTTANTVSINDAAFNSAKVIKLFAYGYLDNEAELSSRGSIGVYWSCESGQNTISGTNGYGGKYLEIDFDGNTAVMGIGVAPRSFGAPVLPIKDPDAKSSSITPWFPVTF